MCNKRSKVSIQKEIVDTFPAILDKARIAQRVGNKLPKSPKVWGSAYKTDKGVPLGIDTMVIYLSPAGELFEQGAPGDLRSLCGFATTGCINTCLGKNTGLLITGTSHAARLWKSALYMGNRRLYRELLVKEAEAHVQKSRKKGRIPALRHDGSSDTAEGVHLAAALPTAEVYDYTKNPGFALRYARGNFPANYTVALSYSGDNEDDCLAVLSEGGKVAAVFDTPRNEALPSHWNGWEIVDGDLHDAIFLQGTGKIIGLRFKWARSANGGRDRAIASAGNFVIRADAEECRLAA